MEKKAEVKPEEVICKKKERSNIVVIWYFCF